jgi:hypothetical protein
MARLNRRARWAVILGLYLGVQLARHSSAGSIFVAIYFLFVLWVWVARPVGNAFLLFDRFARYALRLPEKVEAAAVTGCLTVGLAGVALHFALNSDVALFFGIGGIAIAFPLSLIFTNQAVVGRWVFGAIAAVALLTILLGIVLEYIPFLGPDAFGNLFIGACVACAASTWLGNIRTLHKRA